MNVSELFWMMKACGKIIGVRFSDEVAYNRS